MMRAHKTCLFGAMAIVLGLTAPLRAEITWPVENYDPAAEAVPATPADLILPMPCGGAMAFQKVNVAVEAENPLDDRRIRVGQSQLETGYSDYLRSDYIRGPFVDLAEGDSYYYIARYELTVGQYLALTGTCQEPSRRDRLAQGGLSWFDAVHVSQLYSEWLIANAQSDLPRQDDAIGYVRLPTETEWEYAARGGGKIDPAQFPGRRFFGEEDLSAYAIYLAPGAGRGDLGPVGIRQPNPLGLFDIYGNVEELQLEPFRLNAVGRTHGQVGGLVTRGGSSLSRAEEIYTAQRTEYPMFSSSTGQALAADTFGLRLVLTTNVASSDARLSAIRDQWMSAADAPDDLGDDPLATLHALIEEEIDPRRQTALVDLQFEFRTSQQQAEAALIEATKSTMLSGAVFVSALIDGDQEIRRRQDSVRSLNDQISVSISSQRDELIVVLENMAREIDNMRRVQRTYLLSFRSALETLIRDISPERIDAVSRMLAFELDLAGQDEITRMLERFYNDLSQYSMTPDMSDNDLLVLALNE